MQALVFFFLAFSPVGTLHSLAARVTGDGLGNLDAGHMGSDIDGSKGVLSVLERSSGNASRKVPGELVPSGLLGTCPKDASGHDIDGAQCDYDNTMKCCSSKCRFRTTSRNSIFESAVPRQIDKETLDSLFAKGLHPSVACCRLRAYLDEDGTWTCRKDDMPPNEMIDQISRGPMEHRMESFAQALVGLYDQGIAKMEARFDFQTIYDQGPLTPGEVRAKPLVMLLGGYSTGKTTFIKSLVGKEYRGMHIGVEPTTDSFTFVEYGQDEGVTQGEILSVDTEKGLEGLSQFGNGFLRSFRGTRVDSPILKNFTILDTPGVLSGDKQQQRNYDFEKVTSWFANKADMILLFFDIHKIDISDELKRVIQMIGPNQHKIRIMLNKADSLEPVVLLRSYGALMFGLGRVFSTPELKRIYVGSFRDDEYDAVSEIMHPIFDTDKNLLQTDMKHLASESITQKVNKFIMRVKLAKAHATLLDYLRQQMPYTWGSEKKKQELLLRLPNIYHMLDGVNGIASGDLPDVTDMQEKLKILDFTKINTLKQVWIQRADGVLAQMSRLSARAKEAFAQM